MFDLVMQQKNCLVMFIFYKSVFLITKSSDDLVNNVTINIVEYLNRIKLTYKPPLTLWELDTIN